MKKYFLKKIYKDINKHLRYLSNKEYTICESDSIYENSSHWDITLKLEDCLINIASDRDEIQLSFSPIQDKDYGIAIGTMIFHLSNKETIIGFFEGNKFREKKKQFERLDNLLQLYGDQIIIYFGKDFQKYKDGLLELQKEYNVRLLTGI